MAFLTDRGLLVRAIPASRARPSDDAPGERGDLKRRPVVESVLAAAGRARRLRCSLRRSAVAQSKAEQGPVTERAPLCTAGPVISRVDLDMERGSGLAQSRAGDGPHCPARRGRRLLALWLALFPTRAPSAMALVQLHRTGRPSEGEAGTWDAQRAALSERRPKVPPTAAARRLRPPTLAATGHKVSGTSLRYVPPPPTPPPPAQRAASPERRPRMTHKYRYLAAARRLGHDAI
ncbi:hypothetical protein CDD83_9268 [Cordyceps sp. RAO-2017]|nr:hypothetical protein CDD83_9268 [Cordyceps sp. RAO-2017]